MCTKEKTFRRRVIKPLINDYPSAIYDSLLGNALINKNLIVLENHCIIMRRDHKTMKGKVKIIGGGGAGIEPAEACYVGKGMLTAAVVGDLFTAPSANEIILAIRELAAQNSDGILLLVKNYIGDKLNFQLAMEQACSENITVKMLVIGDDVYDHIPARHGRKGLAGSVLVYKIIGEMAEQGKLLVDIINECREKVLSALATTSVTLVPSIAVACDSLSNFIGHDEVIFGLGVYGNGGVKKLKCTELKNLVSLILQENIQFLKSNSESEETNVAVLINNLGSTTKLEEAVIAKEVAHQLNKLGLQIAQFYVGTFMSTLGAQGFSVSILQITSQDILKYLKAYTSAPAWPNSEIEEFEFETLDLPITISPSCLQSSTPDPNSSLCQTSLMAPILSDRATAAVKQITIFAAEALMSCEKQLNIIDSEAGDGDAGTVLKKAAEALRNAVIGSEMNLKRPNKFLTEISDICCKYMGGLSGALYSVFFKAAAKVFQTSDENSPDTCCKAFKEGVQAIKLYGNAELGDRTILDVLYPAVGSFESALQHGRNLTEAVYLAAITCEFKSEETKKKKPNTLLHKNFTQSLLYADAGSHAATIWLRAISEGLKLHYPSEC